MDSDFSRVFEESNLLRKSGTGPWSLPYPLNHNINVHQTRIRPQKAFILEVLPMIKGFSVGGPQSGEKMDSTLTSSDSTTEEETQPSQLSNIREPKILRTKGKKSTERRERRRRRSSPNTTPPNNSPRCHILRRECRRSDGEVKEERMTGRKWLNDFLSFTWNENLFV